MISATRARRADRIALAALCLLLAAAVAMRVVAISGLASGAVNVGQDDTGRAEVINLGDGVFLPRVVGGRQVVLSGTCWAPAMIELVEPAARNWDALPSALGDRVFYAYRGWMLSDRPAVMKLSVLHYAARAGGFLRIGGDAARHELAVKIVVPAGCDASPEDVMAALRRDVRSRG